MISRVGASRLPSPVIDDSRANAPDARPGSPVRAKRMEGARCRSARYSRRQRSAEGLTCRACRALSGSGRHGSSRPWPGSRTSRRFRRSLPARAVLAMPGYMSVYSWVSPAIEAFRLASVAPIGSPVAGSPTASRYSRWPWAWPVSPSAVERNTVATSLIAFDIGLLREIEIAAVGLALAGKRLFEIFPGLGVVQGGHRGSFLQIRAREWPRGQALSTV